MNLKIVVVSGRRALNELTEIFTRIEAGDPKAAEKLLPLVYAELRKLAATRLAREAPGQTLQPTALVHEAYIKLVDQDQSVDWNSRGHFFAAAAESMRRIMVDRARRKARPKHGGGLNKVGLEEVEICSDSESKKVLAIHEALELLTKEAPQKAELVKLRYFAGMSLEEAATAMEISRATASRYWAFSKAFLYSEIELNGKE